MPISRYALAPLLLLATAPALAGSITRPAPATEHVRGGRSPGVRALGQREAILGVKAGTVLRPGEQAVDFTTRHGRSRVRIRVERSGQLQQARPLSEEFQPRGSASVFQFVFDDAGRVVRQREIRPMSKPGHFKMIETPYIKGQAPPPQIATEVSRYRALTPHKGGFGVTIVDNRDKQHRVGPKGRPAVSQLRRSGIPAKALPADPLERAHLIAKMVDQADRDTPAKEWHRVGEMAEIVKQLLP
jgi:hypothetical protein